MKLFIVSAVFFVSIEGFERTCFQCNKNITTCSRFNACKVTRSDIASIWSVCLKGEKILHRRTSYTQRICVCNEQIPFCIVCSWKGLWLVLCDGSTYPLRNFASREIKACTPWLIAHVYPALQSAQPFWVNTNLCRATLQAQPPPI
jgi:hypothetical protein